MDVRAAVAHEAGKPLTVETVQLEGPKEGEVLVEIKATGICHTDEFTLSGSDPEGLYDISCAFFPLYLYQLNSTESLTSLLVFPAIVGLLTNNFFVAFFYCKGI